MIDGTVIIIAKKYKKYEKFQPHSPNRGLGISSELNLMGTQTEVLFTTSGNVRSVDVFLKMMNRHMTTVRTVVRRWKGELMDREKAIEYLKKDLKCYDNITGNTDTVNCSGSCDTCPNYVKAEIFYQSLKIVIADIEKRDDK